MSFRNTIYSGITTLGREALGNNNNSSQDYLEQKKKKNLFLMNNNKVINNRSKNYEQYYNNKLPYVNSTIQNYKNYQFNKNNLSSGLTTKLNLNNLNIISDSIGNSPTTISTTQIAFKSYNIDPSGSILGNNICRLNNFNNYRVLSLPNK